MLRRALEALTVNGRETKMRAVAERPLEIVEQAPIEIAADVEAVAQAALNSQKSSSDVLDPLGVIVGRDPVLGHEYRQSTCHLV